MSDLAWMKTYIGDEAARTVHLSMEEFGAFERLRRHYWQHGGLPGNDSGKMARIVGASLEQWEVVRSEICGLFEEGWRLPALDAERAAAGEKRAKAIERSQKAHAARYGKDRPAPSTPASIATSSPLSSAYSRPKLVPEAVLDAVLDDCPPAPAPDEVRYEEGLAPTRTHARDDDEELPLDPPGSKAEGQDWLMRQGLWPKQIDALLPVLMAGELRRSRIQETLNQKKRAWT